MLVKVKNYKVLTLPWLNVFVLRYMYEKNQMSIADKTMMMHSVITYGKMEDLDEDSKKLLGHICTILDKEERGGFVGRKELFKQHGIDWKKFHRLPKGIEKIYGKFNTQA